LGRLLGVLLFGSVLACTSARRARTADGGGEAGRDGATRVDVGPPSRDASAPDSARPPADAAPPRDSAPPPDSAVPGTGQYLDRCAAASDCASELCVNDLGGTAFCSRPCGAHRDCADEHLCVEGVCVPDDTGERCNVAAPDTCAVACLGTASQAHCTRQCLSALECPAGYACWRPPGAAEKFCVDIEKPCTAAGSECGTNLCIPGIGCTAPCETASDCPRRALFAGVAPYRCAAEFGSATPICAPPTLATGGDIAGDDAIGTLCSPTPPNQCRSGLCADFDPTDAVPDRCVQSCTAEGGCALGMGCRPQVLDGGAIELFCAPAGSRDLGESCARSADCHSSLCDIAGYCTRLCDDGLCPTGWRCESVPGSSLGICRR